MNTCDSTNQSIPQHYDEMLSNLQNVFNFVHDIVVIPLCVAGVLANILIVAVLLRPSMRSNPFNYFLVVIAFIDATLMAIYLPFQLIVECNPWFYTYKFIHFTRFFAISSVLLHAASLWLTVNMAVLRFILLSRGSSSSSPISIFSCLPTPNSPQAAIISIIMALIIALIGSLPNNLRYEIDQGGFTKVETYCIGQRHGWNEGDTVPQFGLKQPDWWNCHYDRLNFWMSSIVLKLIPCILLTIFMALLVNMLVEARKRRERLTTSSSTSNTQAERTTAMLTIIVAVFLVTEMPQGLALLATGAMPQLNTALPYFQQLFNLLSLINSATNFLLCALMSAVFRKECLLMFSNCCPSRISSNHSRAIPTSLLTLPPSKNGFIAVPTGP